MPRRNPPRSGKKRQSPAHENRDSQIIPTQTNHPTTRKRKHALSGDACPSCLQAACGGCRQKSGLRTDQDLVRVCRGCNKDWHAQRMPREGMPIVGGDYRGITKLQSPKYAYTDTNEAEVEPKPQNQDIIDVTEKLGMSLITSKYNDLVDFRTANIIQAQKAYEEARAILHSVLTEQEVRLNKLYIQIKRHGNGPSEGETEHFVGHRSAKAPKHSDPAGGTSLQETTIHIARSNSGEGCQRQDVFVRSATPENRYTLPSVSVPAALRLYPNVLDQLAVGPLRSDITLVLKDTPVSTGGRSSEGLHSHRLWIPDGPFRRRINRFLNRKGTEGLETSTGFIYREDLATLVRYGGCSPLTDAIINKYLQCLLMLMVG
ncbi:hypothetical protein V491_07932 [Pseudogymnoascus sp. VKM F-3775]|nr:hypothetical protein V491_07932 [Pseudogymnoascus sp. VKM F-3775]